MRFERENAKPIDSVSEKQLLRGLGYMHRPTSGSRFAILSSDSGSYVQVGGCGMCCLLECQGQRAFGDSRDRRSKGRSIAPYRADCHLMNSSSTSPMKRLIFIFVSLLAAVCLGAPEDIRQFRKPRSEVGSD